MSYICGLCKEKGIHKEFDDYLDFEVHILTEHYNEIDWNKISDEGDRMWFRDLSKLMKASKEVYDTLKTIIHSLAYYSNGAFINACIAVKEWEEMDYHIEMMLEALREDSSFRTVFEKLDKFGEEVDSDG